MDIERIKRLAKETKGMSIRELEVELGFGKGTISKWSEVSPTLSKVKAIADFFSVTIDDLIEENPTTKSSEVSSINAINNVTPEEILLINYWRSLSQEDRLQVLKKLGLL